MSAIDGLEYIVIAELQGTLSLLGVVVQGYGARIILHNSVFIPVNVTVGGVSLPLSTT